MTVLEVELAVLILVLAVLAVACWRLTDRLTGAVYDRQKALDGYVKAVTRDKLVVIREAQSAVGDAQAARDEARVVLRQVEQHLNDPRIKRLLDGR